MMSQESKKLNLGCGRDTRPPELGWVNLDAVDLPGVDVVYDINLPEWTVFEDNSFDYVEANMVLEHLDDWVKAMGEIWRICKPGAEIFIAVPFFPSVYSCIDPTHKSFFTYYTFEYFETEHKYKYYMNAQFSIKRRYIRFSWNKILNIFAIPINLFPRVYSRFFAFIFPSNSLEVVLKVAK